MDELTEKELELLEKAVNNSLSNEEKLIFEELLSKPYFKSAFDLEKCIYESVRLKGRRDLKAKLDKIHTKVYGNRVRKYLMLAASIMLVIFGTRFLFNLKTSNQLESSIVLFASEYSFSYKGNPSLFPKEKKVLHLEFIEFEENRFYYNEQSNQLTLFLKDTNLKKIKSDYSRVKLIEYFDEDYSREYIALADNIYTLTKDRGVMISINWTKLKLIDDKLRKIIKNYPELIEEKDSDLFKE